jgi:hypothetical protein
MSNPIFNGFVGINTIAPSFPLHVVGDICTTGSFITISDKTAKTDIVQITNALDKVLSVHGYTFKYKNQPNGQRYAGVMAQEIQEVLPEVVSNDINGQLNVSYGNIIGLLIESIHDLKKEIDIIRGLRPS